MIPLKIRIEGDFWDCQIYRGRLYLFSSNGTLKILDWNSIVQFFIQDPIDELILTCGFIDGRKLYDSNIILLLKDERIKNLLRENFVNQGLRNLVVDSDHINKFLLKEVKNPFNELHTDSEIFSNKIFGITYNGLYSVDVHAKGKHVINEQANRLNSFVAYSLKADKYGKLAVSGGEEGLYEFKASGNETPSHSESRLKKISGKHSSFADYNFISLYNSSLFGDSFLALHKWKEKVPGSQEKPSTILDKEVVENEIFGQSRHNSLSWGTNEKIYRACDNILEVINFNNYASVEDGCFSDMRSFEFQAWKGRILKGGTAYFGAIIECEHALVVLMEQDDFYNIQGAPTRWRVYPRSLNYENHLHVVQDSWIDIYSFNNDYFRPKKKSFGIEFKEEKKFNKFK